MSAQWMSVECVRLRWNEFTLEKGHDMNRVTLEIGILAASLALSFFLSGFEAGVFALNRLRIRNAVRHGRRSARQLLRYLENPENFLWTIFVGNTLANVAAICLIMAHLRIWLGDHPWQF